MSFGTSEQVERLVVVTALEALSKIYMNRDLLPKIAECEKELRKYAFPLEIKLEEIGYCGCDFCITNKREGKKYNMHVKEIKK